MVQPIALHADSGNGCIPAGRGCRSSY